MNKGARILTVSMLSTFVVLRMLLNLSPDADFDLFGYNIHHLFTGLLLLTVSGVPLVLFGDFRQRTHALIIFGIGLAMALDEWVYLVVTDGSNASYLLPVSWWGGSLAVGLAVAYVAALGRRSSSVREDQATSMAPPNGTGHLTDNGVQES